MNRLSQSVEPPRVLNIEDLRRAAKRRLPRVVFDYIDGGAEDESTLRANCRAFETVTLRPPVLESATCVMARRNFLAEISERCCRFLIKFSLGLAGSWRFSQTAA